MIVAVVLFLAGFFFSFFWLAWKALLKINLCLAFMGLLQRMMVVVSSRCQEIIGAGCASLLIVPSSQDYPHSLKVIFHEATEYYGQKSLPLPRD